MRNLARFLLVLGFCMALAACSMLSFFSDKDEGFEPAELIKFKATVKIKRLWTAKLGGDSEFLRVALRPAGDGSRIYAASRDGSVSAFDPADGKRLWRTDLELDLSAGPGVGEGLVAVASSDGLVIVLDAADGTEHWRANIGGESLARPLITDDAVIVQTVDNHLRALRVFDGSERWVVLQSVPTLTMRGSASPILSGSNVVAGFDNGKLIAVELDSGNVAWESMLAPPTGRSDLERLSDVDGAMAIVGQDIYAAGYHGRIGAIAAESGQILWANETSSFVGVSADWSSLYTIQDDGVLIALVRRSGAESWRNEALLRRDPTLPVPFHLMVVVGDMEGYLHFFSNLDGEPVARVKFGGEAISSGPVVLANRLYVQSDSGSIAAYIVDEPKRPKSAPDIADETAEDEGA